MMLVFWDLTRYVDVKYVIVCYLKFEMELLIYEYENMIKDVYDCESIIVKLWW